MQLWQTLAHLFHPRRSNNHRARVLHPEALIALVMVAVGFASLRVAWSALPQSGGSILGFASSITPAQVIQMTNEERSRNGLPALSLNSRLSAAANAKGQHMFANQYWAHTAPDGTQPWTFIRSAGYGYQVAGENLARDFSDTGSMLSAWMASPTHKANIVNTKYQEIGVAVIDGTLQGVETTLVVQMFGAPRITVAQATQPQVAPGVKAATTETPGAEVPASPVAVAAQLTSIEAVPAPVTEADSEVLASALVPQGNLSVPPLFTPLQLLKAFFLGLIMMIIMTLIYDGWVIGHRSALRLVGKNLAHLILLTVVAFLLIFFKGGIVG
jgi:hypothetical protein